MNDITVSGVPCARESAAIVRPEATGNASWPADDHADDHVAGAVPVAAQ
jgi:hypothetical protein